MYAACRQRILSAAGYRRVFIRGYLLICRVDEARKTVYTGRFFCDMADCEEKL